MKGEVVSPRAMKACRGFWGIAPLILNLGARRRWVMDSKSRSLYTWERTEVPIEWRMGGSQSRSGRFGQGSYLFVCLDSNPRFSVYHLYHRSWAPQHFSFSQLQCLFSPPGSSSYFTHVQSSLSTAKSSLDDAVFVRTGPRGVMDCIVLYKSRNTSLCNARNCSRTLSFSCPFTSDYTLKSVLHWPHALFSLPLSC
jgi:hypothetical protein